MPISKRALIEHLEEGRTHREIAEIIGKGKSTVGYWIKRHGLKDKQKYAKPNYNDINYFEKVDTKEKAYIVGFLLGDGTMHKNREIHLTISRKDKCIAEFIQDEIGCNIRHQERKPGYPMLDISIGKSKFYNDLYNLFKGRIKKERSVPKVNNKFRKYLVLGFLDADGSISYGYRSKTNKFWFKISFASKGNILKGIQEILLKENILCKVKKHKTKNVCTITMADRHRGYHFINWIYDDLVVLPRKYNQATKVKENIENQYFENAESEINIVNR